MHRYVVGVLFFAVVWLLLFVSVPPARRVMLASGFTFSLAGPIGEYWHTRDYWLPEFFVPISLGGWTFGVEDLAFAGFWSSTGVGLYEFFLARTGIAPPPMVEWPTVSRRLIAGIAIVVPAMLLLTDFLQMNSLPATMIIMVCVGLLAIQNRPKCLPGAIQAGLVGGLLMWFFYWGFYLRIYPDLIRKWWKAEALSGISLAGVPLEEVFWASVAFFVAGPVFRFLLLSQGSLSTRALPKREQA